MKFCGSCGKQIPDDALACPYCGTFQEDDAVPVAKPKAKSKSKSGKPFPTKLVVIGLLAVAVVVGAVFGAIALFGGGWEDPLEDAVEILNNKKFTADAVKDLGRCFAGDTGEDALDSFVDKAFDVDIDGYDVRDLVGIDYLLDHLEDDYGKDWKITYEVTSRESLDSDDLQDYQDAYHDIAKVCADAAKTVKNNADYISEYETDGEMKEKDIKSLGEDAKTFFGELKDCEITKGYALEVTFQIEGEDGDDEVDVELAVIKLNGEWVLSLSYDQLMDLADELEDMDGEDLLYMLF